MNWLQTSKFNATLTRLSNSLKAAPELKSLPNEVEELKKNVAQFGSRLTEMESKVDNVPLVKPL